MANSIQRAIAIPEPTDQPVALWRTTQALKEAVEVLQGTRGNRTAALKIDLDSITNDLQTQINNLSVGTGGGGYEPKNSIEVDAGEIQLVNDLSAPGNDYFYGTGATGTKGWYVLPASGGLSASAAEVITGGWTFQTAETSFDSAIWMNGASNYMDIADGGQIYFQNADNTGSLIAGSSTSLAHVDFTGDGAVDRVAFNNLAYVQLLSGCGLDVYDSDDLASFSIYVDTDVGYFDGTATGVTDFDFIVPGTVKINGVPISGSPTALSTGTVTATTYGITSDGGTDDVVLPEANTSQAGLLGAAKWNEIVANTAKAGNATHTGEVTGSGVLTVDPTAISNKTSVGTAAVDVIMFYDVTDNGLKKATIDQITDGGYF